MAETIQLRETELARLQEESKDMQAAHDAKLHEKATELEGLKQQNADMTTSLAQKEGRIKEMVVRNQEVAKIFAGHKKEAIDMLGKLQREGEDFKCYYADFKGDPTAFPVHVFNRMFADTKQTKQRLQEVEAQLQIVRLVHADGSSWWRSARTTKEPFKRAPAPLLKWPKSQHKPSRAHPRT